MAMMAMAAGMGNPAVWRPSMPPRQQQQQRSKIMHCAMRGRDELCDNLRLVISKSRKAAALLVIAVFFAFGVNDAAALALIPHCGSTNAQRASLVASSESEAKDNCNKGSDEDDADLQPAEVTNESLVEAAWQVVNDVFLDARQHAWSPDAWLAEKEKVLKKPLGNKAAAYSAIRSMLSTLHDPFTRFLPPTEVKSAINLDRLGTCWIEETTLAVKLDGLKYDITGIGLNIGELSDGDEGIQIRVIGIVLDSPAQLAGIQEGDEILSVDGSNVIGWTAFEVASAIQGRKGTPVTIEVKHAHCANSQKFIVYRQQELQSPVFYRLERSDGGGQLKGYLRLREFNALTKRDLVTAMERLKAAGASSFVLDLRDNLGGLVQEGIEVAKIFLEDGQTVVYTARRDAGSLKGIVAKGEPLSREPLMVLVNDRTASASEIVAAALHDNCRAVLVGSKTFGKGLIQSVYELNDGSGIILTVGKYVTPGHMDIDRNGLEPDFKRMPGLAELSQKLRTCQALRH